MKRPIAQDRPVWNRGRRFLERTDAILGRVRLCTTCGEEWPVDDEFFYFQDGKVLGRCKACWVDWNRMRRKTA